MESNQIKSCVKIAFVVVVEKEKTSNFFPIMNNNGKMKIFFQEKRKNDEKIFFPEKMWV